MPQQQDATPLRGKTAVITGAAHGLGFGAAESLALLGADLVLVDVQAQALAEAQARMSVAFPRQRISGVVADLAEPDSIAKAAAGLRRDISTVDILVNNAGIYPPSQLRRNSEGHELTFAIAHLGHFRWTHLLLPALSRSARIITVSSLVQGGARLRLDNLDFTAGGYQPIVAYRQAKLSCLLFALELQRKLADSGSLLRSIAVHPGVCRTTLGRNRPRSAGDALLQRVSSELLAWGLGHFGQTPREGAQSIVMAAADPEVPGGAFLGPRGIFQAFGRPAQQQPGKAASNEELARALWQYSERVTGLNLASVPAVPQGA
ncbi:SDR family NAD(P)-dependent oxidoreductase [Nevskia soli]|uniref:SDR family NAD(P)-dependent oxidoreductase n=1 Tax=Nevskia soli TaxID=418856 RepID=UPI00068F65C4|nr:SDR family NAD(P)-dependent oxidoreductase [Nevskia soli]